MTAATNSEQQAALACEIDGMTNIVHVLATRNQRRTLVVHAVPDFAGAIVVRMTGKHDRAGHRIAELLERRSFELDLGAVERDAANAGTGSRWRRAVHCDCRRQAVGRKR